MMINPGGYEQVDRFRDSEELAGRQACENSGRQVETMSFAHEDCKRRDLARLSQRCPFPDTRQGSLGGRAMCTGNVVDACQHLVHRQERPRQQCVNSNSPPGRQDRMLTPLLPRGQGQHAAGRTQQERHVLHE